MSFFFKDPITFSKRPEGTDEFSRKLVAYDSSGFGWVITPDLSGTNFTLQPNPTFYRDFATYKTLNHGEGPNINFTRGTSATYFDSAGVLKMASINEPRFDHSNFRTNLATWSVFTSSGTLRWTNVFPSFATILTGIDAPDGSTTAVRLSANNQGAALFRVNINPFTVSVSGTPYTLSFWCRRVSGTGSPSADLNDGAPGNGISYADQLTDNVWRRVSLSGIPLSGAKTWIDVYDNKNTNLVLDYWGLQLETGLSATAYIPVSGSAVTVGESRGLLIEEARTNIALHSADLANAHWAKTNVTVTSNTDVAPDGTTTADTVEDTTTGSIDNLIANQSVGGAANGETFTWSFFIKKTTGATNYPAARLLFSGGTAIQAHAVIDTNNGTITATGSNVISFTASVQNAGSYWRVICTGTNNSTGNTNVAGRIHPAYNLDGTGTQDANATGSIVVWGGQLEKGAFPTSYIPTTTAAATRSADSAVVTPISSFYNQSEGTLFGEASTTSWTANSLMTVVAFDQSTNAGDNVFRIIRNGPFGASPNNKLISVYRSSGADVAALASADGTWLANVVGRVASAYAQNSFAASLNGGAVLTDTSGALTTMDRMWLGNWAMNEISNGHIRKIAYWPKRLSNTFLQQQTQ